MKPKMFICWPFPEKYAHPATGNQNRFSESVSMELCSPRTSEYPAWGRVEVPSDLRTQQERGFWTYFSWVQPLDSHWFLRGLRVLNDFIQQTPLFWNYISDKCFRWERLWSRGLVSFLKWLPRDVLLWFWGPALLKYVAKLDSLWESWWLLPWSKSLSFLALTLRMLFKWICVFYPINSIVLEGIL